MTDDARIPLEMARERVEQVVSLLRPHCQRVEIGGSIRRGKATVKDAEIVAIPSPGLLPHLDELVIDGRLLKAVYVDKNGRSSNRWGKSYRGVALPDAPGFKIELFLTDAASWGYQFWLRTGPGDMNQRVMLTLINRNAPIRFRDGHCVWARGGWRKVGDQWRGTDEVRLNVPDEDTLFAILGLPFMQPHERNEDNYRAGFHNHRFPTDLTRYLLDEPPPPPPSIGERKVKLFNTDSPRVIDDAPKAVGNGARASVCYWLSGLDEAAWARQCQAEALASARRLLDAFDSGRVVVSGDYREITRANVERMARESA